MPHSSETVLLASHLDVTEVASLSTQLLSIAAEAKVVLDARNVTHFGSLCAQAIIAGAKRATEHSGSYEIVNLSPETTAQLKTMGLSNSLLVEG